MIGVNEAGLISAAVGAAPEVEPIAPPVEQAGQRLVPPIPNTAIPAGLQGAVAVIAALVAFAPSILNLAADLPPHRPLGAISLVPGIALLLTALIAIRRGPPEPEIHDRYVDYILGLSLLAVVTASLIWLPASLSIFFWSWRLDLLAFPLFLAGTLTILCGARTLWRFRLPLGILLLGWPLPYVVAGLTGRFFDAEPAVLGALGLLAALALVRSAGRRPRVHATVEPTGARHGGGLIAAAMVLLAAVLTLAADRRLDAAMHLLQPDGQPKLSAAVRPAASIGGTPRTDTATQTGPIWGSPANDVTYNYGAAPGIQVSFLTPMDARDLELAPAAVVEGQGYHTLSAQSADLGAAISGHLERYGSGTALVTIVWWDWPVQSPGGVLRQRVIVERVAGPGAGGSTDAAQVEQFARSLVSSVSRASGS